MSLVPFLDAVGLNGAVIMAAFAGAIARLAFAGPGNSGAFAILISVVGGTLTGIFLGPIGPAYLGWADNAKSTGAVCFLVAAFSMEIFKRIGVAIAAWTPTIVKGKNDA